ncbi:MAG: hypothetical protein K2N94_09375 [Lachnospiraceae bacterium]|nr:hypothetical protein [Lachnospiraceae bacterium]
MDNPNGITLNIYLHMLIELQNYEEILSLYETESSVKQILFPPAEKNLGAWWTILYAAEELGEAEFVEKQMAVVMESGNKEDEYFYLTIFLYSCFLIYLSYDLFFFRPSDFLILRSFPLSAF